MMHDNRENTHNELLSEPTIFWEVYGVNAYELSLFPCLCGKMRVLFTTSAANL